MKKICGRCFRSSFARKIESSFGKREREKRRLDQSEKKKMSSDLYPKEFTAATGARASTVGGDCL